MGVRSVWLRGASAGEPESVGRGGASPGAAWGDRGDGRGEAERGERVSETDMEARVTLGELKEQIDRMLAERPALSLSLVQIATKYGGTRTRVVVVDDFNRFELREM